MSKQASDTTGQPDEVPLHVVRRMRRAYMSICRCGDAVLGAYQMTTDQYSLLRAVQRNDGIRQADLGNEVFADPNTITAMVSLLEKRGMIRRESCPMDGRARRIHVTPLGNRTMRRLSAAWEPMRQRLAECFGDEGPKVLDIMDRVSEAMTESRKEILAGLPTQSRKKRVGLKAGANKTVPLGRKLAASRSGLSA